MLLLPAGAAPSPKNLADAHVILCELLSMDSELSLPAELIDVLIPDTQVSQCCGAQQLGVLACLKHHVQRASQHFVINIVDWEVEPAMAVSCSYHVDCPGRMIPRP